MSKETPRTEKCIDRSKLTNYCSHCEREFLPEKAHSVHIRGPGDVVWSCPNCKRTSNGIAPEESVRPPVIKDLVVAADNGLTTAAIVFPNGTRLQFRETADGHVREEVLTSTGEELESIGHQEAVSTFGTFATAIKRYRKLTKSGVRREMPHVAAAILDAHER